MKYVEIFLYYLIKGIIVLGLLGAVFYQDWSNVFWVSLIFILTFVPTIIAKQSRLYFPLEFDLFIIIFIFLSLFLGEVHHYYYTFWWWDLYLHVQSGILLGILGFIVSYILNEQRHFKMRMRPMMTAMFAFSFSITLGVLWEIFEFGMDQVFGLNMQKSGLIDTMTDLIVDTFGASIIATLGYLWMKRKIDFWIFDRSISKFIRKNSHLFEKN
ncbi:MAG: hypothetical protein KBB55_02375 [Candidatus Buchananbacteria bacterium]|nr:hypothetical protein [Candidatus Buchananbacteria bacterium]